MPAWGRVFSMVSWREGGVGVGRVSLGSGGGGAVAVAVAVAAEEEEEVVVEMLLLRERTLAGRDVASMCEGVSGPATVSEAYVSVYVSESAYVDASSEAADSV
jgi:hypothetical protein